MNNRRRITGVVTSNKMTKTVVVEINRVFRHPLYKKVVHLSKRIMAHDEIGCQVGDKVQVVESRPLSREKRWVVETVIKREIRPRMRVWKQSLLRMLIQPRSPVWRRNPRLRPQLNQESKHDPAGVLSQGCR